MAIGWQKYILAYIKTNESCFKHPAIIKNTSSLFYQFIWPVIISIGFVFADMVEATEALVCFKCQNQGPCTLNDLILVLLLIY